MNILPLLTHRKGSMMPLSPLERKAAFMAAVTLKETTKTAAALELGVSWTHVECVLLGEREASEGLKGRIADYVGTSVEEFWTQASESAA